MSTNRFAVHFHHPLINYHERDGDPFDNIEMAISHALLKADLMVSTSVNKIKILKQERQSDSSLKIILGYTSNNQPTGAYIEVREVPKFNQGKAMNISETHAGIQINDSF